MQTRTEFEPLFRLNRAERIQLVEDLWDSIAEESEVLPLTAEQVEELRARRERFQKNPGAGRTWEQVKQRALAAHD